MYTVTKLLVIFLFNFKWFFQQQFIKMFVINNTLKYLNFSKGEDSQSLFSKKGSAHKICALKNFEYWKLF
jgi:hypothetical protein